MTQLGTSPAPSRSNQGSGTYAVLELILFMALYPARYIASVIGIVVDALVCASADLTAARRPCEAGSSTGC
jgi:hypothetical protein